MTLIIIFAWGTYRRARIAMLIAMLGARLLRKKAAVEIVIATASWCPHCVAIKPEIRALGEMVRSADGVSLKLLDSEADAKEIEKYDVRGYPSIFFLAGSRRINYEGERKAASILAQAMTVLAQQQQQQQGKRKQKRQLGAEGEGQTATGQVPAEGERARLVIKVSLIIAVVVVCALAGRRWLRPGPAP